MDQPRTERMHQTHPTHLGASGVAGARVRHVCGLGSVVTLAGGRAITGAGFIGAVVTGLILTGITRVTVELRRREALTGLLSR